MNTLLLAGAALSVAGLGFLLMVRSPRLAFLAWLVALCGVPVWVGIPLVIAWEPHVVASLALATSLVVAVLTRANREAGRVIWADGLMVLFVAAGLVPAVIGRASVTEIFELVVQWSMAFLAGRLIGYRVPLRWVHGALAVAFTLVAVVALVEFFSGWNPFVQIPGSAALYDAWSPIQMRGGQARAEGAFGHSIALGASLAMAVPLTLAAPFRAVVRLAMVGLMVGAVVVTFSRTGLLTAVLGIALTVLALRSGLSARLRWMVVGGLVVAAVASSSLLARVFAAAGSEAADSAGYRIDLLSLLPTVRLFGTASSLTRLPTGEQFFGSFHSIDNALLLLALVYGWVPTVLALLLLGGAAWCVLTRQGTAATIALAAQIPAFASVALITQYATLTWFVAGLAVFGQALQQSKAPPEESARAPAAGSPEMVSRPRDLIAVPLS